MGRIARIVLACVCAAAACAAPAPNRWLFVGTYTGVKSKGIYAFRFNDRTGALTPVGLVAETTNPSFLTLSADGRRLFAVNETARFGEEASGSVSAFSVDQTTGALALINVQSSRGADPCHLMIDPGGRFLAVANYTGGTFSILPIGPDGRLGPASVVISHHGNGPNAARQEGPHAHDAVFDPDGAFLYGVDLGLDRIFVFDFDRSTGHVRPAAPPDASVPPGAGPRHLAFHPNGRTAYSINELASTITTFAWNRADGTLTPGASVSTLPDDFHGTSTAAEIAIHPNGRFLYGSNRGHDSVAVFTVQPDGSVIRGDIVPTLGRTPRSFVIAPGGRWLLAANQDSDSIAVFRIDPSRGTLTPAGAPAEVPTPVSLAFRP